MKLPFRLYHLSAVALCLLTVQVTIAKKTVFTVWGNEEMDNPLVEEILASPAMERLKGIDQSGPPAYFSYTCNGKQVPLTAPFSRYDHCVGVWALLKRAGTPLEEQVAGLLHDASHTVFSHLADTLFNYDTKTHKNSYQDSIHDWFLDKMNVGTITKKYGIPLHTLNPDSGHYLALERPRPLLCADRIQYTIHTGVIFNQITNVDAQEIVNDLCFENNQWFFKTPGTAKKFAKLSLHFNKTLWDAPYNKIFYEFFSEILQLSFSDGLFSKEDFHFKTDQELLSKIKGSSNPTIQALLKKCDDIYKHFTVVPYGKGTYNYKPKFWGIDPLVKTANGFKTLQAIDPEFKKECEEVQHWCKEGYGIVV